MLHGPEDPLGPEAPPPPPEVCRKCSSQSLCVIWDKHPHSIFRAIEDVERAEKPVFECPVHGWFERVKGQQLFDAPDTWVEGPNGEKLFTL